MALEAFWSLRIPATRIGFDSVTCRRQTYTFLEIIQEAVHTINASLGTKTMATVMPQSLLALTIQLLNLPSGLILPMGSHATSANHLTRYTPQSIFWKTTRMPPCLIDAHQYVTWYI